MGNWCNSRSFFKFIQLLPYLADDFRAGEDLLLWDYLSKLDEIYRKVQIELKTSLNDK